MPYQFLTTKRVRTVEYVTLNRPEVRNALDDQTVAELIDWASQVEQAAHQHDVRAVVLSGAGKAFCAGADATWMSKTAAYTESENLRDAEAVAKMFGAIDQLPVPVIARVHGAALGGGAGLAAVSDIVIADDQAVFGFTEVKLGLLPATISPFVLAKIGRGVARALFLTGMRISAAHAKAIGLVHTVVPVQELDTTIDEYISEIMTAGPEAVAAAKALIREVWGRTPVQAADITAAAIAAQRVSVEGREGLKAFLEKRKPSWSG